MDLRDFFPSFAAGRIQAFFFGTLGYPESVAVFIGWDLHHHNASLGPKEAGCIVGVNLLQEARVVYSNPPLPQGRAYVSRLSPTCVTPSRLQAAWFSVSHRGWSRIHALG